MNLSTFSLTVCLITSSVTASFAQAGEPATVVADFEHGVTVNNLGGRFNVCKGGESVASLRLTGEQRNDARGSSLLIQATQSEGGFCGLWMHLFETDKPQAKYFDARDYDHLSFWVKGVRGGEQFTISLGDRRWVQKEDALPIAGITELLPEGVTTAWQEVRLPMKLIERLDLEQLGSVVLNFDVDGSHAIVIDDVRFVRGALPTVEEDSSAVTASLEETGEDLILYPKVNTQVAPQEQITASLANDRQAVVLVRSTLPNSRWWVQGPANRSPEGNLTAEVRYGNSKTPNLSEFRVLLLLPKSQEEARQYKTGDSLMELPAGVAHSRAIQVVLNK